MKESGAVVGRQRLKSISDTSVFLRFLHFLLTAVLGISQRDALVVSDFSVFCLHFWGYIYSRSGVSATSCPAIILSCVMKMHMSSTIHILSIILNFNRLNFFTAAFRLFKEFFCIYRCRFIGHILSDDSCFVVWWL